MLSSLRFRCVIIYEIPSAYHHHFTWHSLKKPALTETGRIIAVPNLPSGDPKTFCINGALEKPWFSYHRTSPPDPLSSATNTVKSTAWTECIAEITSNANEPTPNLRYSGSMNMYIIAPIVADRLGLMLYSSLIVVSTATRDRIDDRSSGDVNVCMGANNMTIRYAIEK